MSARHPNSPCCAQPIQRFGQRRRRCSRCGRTWRIRPKKRGRKRRRVLLSLVLSRLRDNRPLVQQAAVRRVTVKTTEHRFRQALESFLAGSAPPALPTGHLVLLLDGVWFRFQGQLWTLYVLALKPIAESRAYFRDPLLLPGRENYDGWQAAVATLTPAERAAVRAMVSDGFRGSKALARSQGWIPQRCHFHLLAQFQARRGRRKALAVPALREAIYRSARKALQVTDERELRRVCTRLRRLIAQRDCPHHFRTYTRGLLRDLPAFRAYQLHPQLQLPTTTNVIEAMANILRQTLRTVRTPNALYQWVVALIRIRPFMACNGKQIQPN